VRVKGNPLDAFIDGAVWATGDNTLGHAARAEAEGKKRGLLCEVALIPLATFEDVMAVAEFAATLPREKLDRAVSLAKWLESYAPRDTR
jgi:hypothetical protein